MKEKQNSKDTEYRYREDNQPSKASDEMLGRDNNANNEDISAAEPNVENANRTGIGDSGLNDTKLTNHTSNHSADA